MPQILSLIVFRILLFGFLSFVYSCASSADGQNDEVLIEVKILDSIKFETDNEFVIIRSFNDSLFLGRNATKDKLFLFNAEGKRKRIIARKGEGPSEYEELLNYGLASNGDIYIFDGQKVLIFSYDSDHIDACPSDIDRIFPELNDNRLFVTDNGEILMSSSTNDDPSYLKYFDSVHTMTIIDTACEYRNLGGYPDESIFRERVYIMGYDVKTQINRGEENKAFQVFRWDKNLYIWDIQTDTLIQSISLNPDHFGEIVQRSQGSFEDMMYSMQRNPRYIDFIVGDQYILTYYMAGLRDENISASIEKYNKTLNEIGKRLFSIYDRDGNKLGPDFADDRIDYLIGFDKNQNLLFQTDNEDGNVKIYKAELITTAIN